jgi:hypothetical protein
MSRTRLIKPALFENELLGQMDGDTVLTFIGLWCMADREGRLEDRPLRLKAKLFPYRQVSIENALSQLEEGGFLIRYTINEEAFIHVVNFAKHQHPHRAEQASVIPPVPSNLPTKDGRTTDQGLLKDIPCTVDAGPSPLTLNPLLDTLTLNQSSPDGEQVVGVEQHIVKASRPRKAKLSPEGNPDFMAFWEAYPRKMSKPAAFAAWIKAKLPAIADILAAVEAQTASEQWQKDGGKFIPYPTTWINGERWNDQFPKPPTISEYANF